MSNLWIEIILEWFYILFCIYSKQWGGGINVGSFQWRNSTPQCRWTRLLQWRARELKRLAPDHMPRDVPEVGLGLRGQHYHLCKLASQNKSILNVIKAFLDDLIILEGNEVSRMACTKKDGQKPIDTLHISEHCSVWEELVLIDFRESNRSRCRRNWRQMLVQTSPSRNTACYLRKQTEAQ